MISTAPDTCQAQRPTDVIKVKRHCYIHVLDNNTNVTRTLVGPLVYTRLEHESSLFEPQSCIWVPAQSYCEVKNPVIHKDDGSGPVLEPSGQARLRMGDSEIRLHGPPFPLYPGEELVSRGGQTVFSLDVIAPNEGYHVRCLRDFVDEKKKKISAGTEWMEAGPKTYIPRVEVTLVKKVHAEIIKPHTALRLSARSNFTDRSGTARVAGEHWCVRTPGAYLPFVEENIVGMIDGFVLSNRWALHLMALQNYTDVYNTKRLAGEMWLVSSTDASVHIVDVHEKVMKKVEAISLSSQQYCIILNPVGADGKNMYGEELVRRGECTFFLRPGEKAPGGVQEVEVVGKDEALLLKARSSFTDNGVTRPPGSTWMLHGPTEYVPDSHVTLVERRKVIALDKNEGIYVMNTRTGVVRAVIGEPYMPTEDEVLWEKHLPPEVEELLASPGGSQKISQRDSNFQSVRDRSRIVRFNVQHNAAVQIYDYRKKTPRIVFGPDLVILAPHEEFTVLSLSGGKPKVPNALQSLQLFLGPRFSSDTIIVETSDHARLQLRLSYNWHFDVDRKGSKQKSFAVPDFIGDCCKTIASRVRGAVASEDFDSFHRNSAKIIRSAVFGVDADGEARKELRFQANDFVVTNVDVQFAEPTDEKTRDSLQKSVQLAIEITTKSLEAAARHGNELKDQVAKGQLECQRLLDKIAVEKAKTQWLELQAKSEAVQASGQSVAEARAKAEALLIEVTSELRQAELRSKAYQISAQSELKKLQQRQSIELEYTTRQNEMEVEKARRLAESEAEKVKRTLDAIGRETIVAIAQAGPELQAKLLSGLGLKGYLITDGNSPVNLFHTAQGMVGSGGAPPQ